VPSFQQGGIAIQSGNNSAKGLAAQIGNNFEWDVMPTPRWAGTKRRSTNWNHQGHIVMKQAETRGHADAAVQFAMWMTGEDASTIVSKVAGTTPVNKKLAMSNVYLDGTPPGLKTQLDLLTKKPDQDARGFRIFKSFTPWNTAVQPVINEAMFGLISVRDMGIKGDQVGNTAIDTAPA
jgi:ABC-type glycerol-3-phosphate transport system substrate-binding protein